MSLGRICVREVDLAEPQESVQTAAERMHARNVGSLVILDEDKHPLGIVTDRDLTLRVRTFTVPLDWPASGAAKAASTGIPVLADRRLSEFSSDPFFDLFSSSVYVAIPLRLRGVVNAVLVADNADADRPIAVEDISLIYSMSQQASTAMDRLYEAADNARKFRVLRKLQDALAQVEDPKHFSDAVSAMLSMTARAIGATGALMKDPVRKKLTHVKTVDDVDASDRETDISITDAFDDILERAAGSMKPV